MLREISSEIWTDFLHKMGKAWWVEVTTQSPNCTYYFGPFADAQAALSAQPGYIEDLQQEQTHVVSISIKRCQPEKLTIFDDEN